MRISSSLSCPLRQEANQYQRVRPEYEAPSLTPSLASTRLGNLCPSPYASRERSRLAPPRYGHLPYSAACANEGRPESTSTRDVHVCEEHQGRLHKGARSRNRQVVIYTTGNCLCVEATVEQDRGRERFFGINNSFRYLLIPVRISMGVFSSRDVA
jgi:hypothetical protein